MNFLSVGGTGVISSARSSAWLLTFFATIPFSQGAKEIVAWFDADPAR